MYGSDTGRIEQEREMMKNKALDGGCGTLLYYQNPNFPVNLYLHVVNFDEPEVLPPYRDPRTNPPGARD